MRHSRLICPVLVALFSLINASETVKRAPSGFQGVRGKKSIQDTYPEAAVAATNSGTSDGVTGETENLVSEDVKNLRGLDKRAPSAGFHGMRGKKNPLSFSGYPYPPMSINDVMLLPKRAPMGFMGMRGKKEMDMSDEFEKRAPNMGFLGMRGKKEYDGEFDGSSDYFLDKRAPNMGFLGMRGKKDFEDASYLENTKRAPANGFFGMRGKKQPGRSSFFGMRGKKYPYEFRGKFVGVRGKKDSSDTMLGNENLNNYYWNSNALPTDEELAAELSSFNLPADGFGSGDLNDLMVLLTQGSDGGVNWEKRKGPSGFLGMRG